MVAKTKKTVVAEGKKSAEKPMSASEREAWIATSAYYMAEARGFAPGNEIGDWLRAEQQLAAHAVLD